MNQRFIIRNADRPVSDVFKTQDETVERRPFVDTRDERLFRQRLAHHVVRPGDSPVQIPGLHQPIDNRIIVLFVALDADE